MSPAGPHASTYVRVVAHLLLHPPVDAGTRTVWVSRHGRTVANEQEVMQGWGDHRLSTQGRRDVQGARRWWQRRPVERVVASPVARALETAGLLFARVDDIDAGWAEQACPGLAGMTAAAAHAARPDLCRLDGWARRDAPRDPAQEHQDTVTARALGALLRAATAVPAAGAVAVVTHGAVLVGLLDLAGARADRIDNLAVLEIEVEPTAGWLLRDVHAPLDA